MARSPSTPIANSYPGIYQGLVTTCSYPDMLSPGAQFADYHLLRRYFEDPSRWAPGVVWSDADGSVEGHISHVNAVAADEGLFKAALNPENDCSGTVDTVAGRHQHPLRLRDQPRRRAVLGARHHGQPPRPAPRGAPGAPQEKAVGHGFAGIPFANTGMQYGLNALRRA